MDVVRIGIIGLGNMGTGHMRNILDGKVPRLTLTAVADLLPERRAAARDLCKEKLQFDTFPTIFESGKDLIESDVCDAVLIAVPHYQHPALTISALQHGKHVLCEKPAGVYTKQVREMNEAAANSDRVFAMMFNQRTN